MVAIRPSAGVVPETVGRAGGRRPARDRTDRDPDRIDRTDWRPEFALWKIKLTPGFLPCADPRLSPDPRFFSPMTPFFSHSLATPSPSKETAEQVISREERYLEPESVEYAQIEGKSNRRTGSERI